MMWITFVKWQFVIIYNSSLFWYTVNYGKNDKTQKSEEKEKTWIFGKNEVK